MMTGDYTKVPLRLDDRWTGARMQQGRVLLDHEWNLNLDAAARAARAAAADIIGPAGVVEGSPDFQVSVTPSGDLDVAVHAGRMWVDGLMAYAPEDVAYTAQDQIAPSTLSATGNAFVYLDVFEENVQPAEDGSLVDPALAPVDSAARTRIGYRVRVAPTTATTCKDAWAALTLVAGSTGLLSIDRTAPSGPSDPCAPPGDPLGQLPDGLFRVEVLDAGTQATSRFAWSYENGSAAVAVAPSGIAGPKVTLVPSVVEFRNGDLVEVSWLSRRADRVAHGALYKVSAPPETGAGGDILTFDRAVTAPADADGLAVRRWDGEAVGAAAAATTTFRGVDLGVTFTAGTGAYEVGDWWGARMREEDSPGIEARSNVAPDGTRHVFAPLALVDLGARVVLHDCRPTFVPLTELRLDAGSCTVSVKPGDDLQAALDSLPPGGGELCLAAGVYPLDQPLLVKARTRIVMVGAGAATILRATKAEAAVVVDSSAEIELRHLRVEGGTPGGVGDPHLNGAVTAIDPQGLVVADCTLACPGTKTIRMQTCITVRHVKGAFPDGIRLERNSFEVGPWQTGVLLLDVDRALVGGNHFALPPGAPPLDASATDEITLRILRKLIATAIAPQGATTVAVAIPGAGQINVVKGTEGEKLVSALAPTISESLGKRLGARKALDSATRHALSPVVAQKLSTSIQNLIALVRKQLVAAGQGIVVGGTHAGTIQILDNVVEDAVQGIHVGVSQQKLQGATAEQVVVARNIVHLLVPHLYPEERHAIFVGNARSIHVIDTVATLQRLGGENVSAPPTDVEGIRIYGELGPFLCVRQSSLHGFHVGVRVVPVGAIPQGMWVVAETMAVQATAALAAPAVVLRDRNVP
jgi:hypothetical protein